MGDYSSTFTILNLLDSDLSPEYRTPTDGYWLRKVDVVEANSTTTEIQLKDSFGFSGTDGQLWLRGMLRGREFVVYIHVKCGRVQNNVATIESPDKRLELGVSGFIDAHTNPMTGIKFTIQALA